MLAFGGLQRRGRRGKRVVLLLVALVLLLVGLQACGGGGSGSSGGGQPGTPIGDYAITVTATSTSGSLTHSTQVMLDVR